MIKKRIAKLVATITLICLPVMVYAADDVGPLYDQVKSFYFKLLLPIGAVLAGFVIMYAGIAYAMSEGDPGKTQAAREYIIGAVSGLILLITAAMIIQTITQ